MDALAGGSRLTFNGRPKPAATVQSSKISSSLTFGPSRLVRFHLLQASVVLFGLIEQNLRQSVKPPHRPWFQAGGSNPETGWDWRMLPLELFLEDLRLPLIRRYQ